MVEGQLSPVPGSQWLSAVKVHYGYWRYREQSMLAAMRWEAMQDWQTGHWRVITSGVIRATYEGLRPWSNTDEVSTWVSSFCIMAPGTIEVVPGSKLTTVEWHPAPEVIIDEKGALVPVLATQMFEERTLLAGYLCEKLAHVGVPVVPSEYPFDLAVLEQYPLAAINQMAVQPANAKWLEPQAAA